jgi:hypothetical protein
MSGTWRAVMSGTRVSGTRVLSARRWLGVDVRRMALKARVSGTQRYQNAGVRYAAVSGCGCQVRGGISGVALDGRVLGAWVSVACRCQVRGAGVRCETVAGAVSRRGCQARGGIGARVSGTWWYRGASVRHVVVSGTRVSGRGGIRHGVKARGCRARAAGTRRCQA